MRKTDGTLRYMHPHEGRNARADRHDRARGPHDVRSDGKDGGATWVSVASVASSIDKVAWGCCTANGKAGAFAAGLKADGLAVD